MIVSASGGGFKKIFLLIDCPLRFADLISDKETVHPKKTIIDKVLLKFSVQHVGKCILH